MDDTDSAPVREPAAVGVKFTLAVQFAPGASVAPQFVVRAKSPETLIDETFAVASPGC